MDRTKFLFLLIGILLLADILLQVFYGSSNNSFSVMIGVLLIVYVVLKKSVLQRFVLRYMGEKSHAK